MGEGPELGGATYRVQFALANLPRMRLRSGLYCYDWAHGEDRLRGESVRYSLMVLLGLQRAAAHGASAAEIESLWRRCLDRRGDFTAGDVGLAIWADSRLGGEQGAELVAALERKLPQEDALAPLAGMEIGWMLLGLAEIAGDVPAAERALRRIVGHLRTRRRARSGLYYHDAATRLRSRLPNFATQIYTLAALTSLARLGIDDAARGEAEQLGEHLLRLQLDDGGWPWLFDADRACVIERYEIYSVHQDAMAPMALLPLGELTGDRRWCRAAVEGLAWSRGANELGVDLFDDARGFVHRSIRRKRPWDRLALWTASASGRALGRPLVVPAGGVELNATCRPYHLGWILEAWAGREALTQAPVPDPGAAP